jgi:hypothetical protein
MSTSVVIDSHLYMLEKPLLQCHRNEIITICSRPSYTRMKTGHPETLYTYTTGDIPTQVIMTLCEIPSQPYCYVDQCVHRSEFTVVACENPLICAVAKRAPLSVVLSSCTKWVFNNTVLCKSRGDLHSVA